MEETSDNADRECKESEVTFLSALQHKYSDEDYRVLFAGLLCQERERERQQQQQEHEQENRPCAPGAGRGFACPPYVVLQNFGINRLGGIEELSRSCVHLREIDLSFNRLSKWSEIRPLLQHTWHLESLNLSFNPLHSLQLAEVREAEVTKEECPLCPLQASNAEDTGCLHPAQIQSSLRRLILNGSRIDGRVVLALLDTLPRVEDLHLSLNEYASFGEDGGESGNPNRMKQLHRLKELHIDNNRLQSWRELLRIGRTFPHLQTLFASHNPLSDLQDMENDELRDSFPGLHKLHLNHSELHSWPGLDKLQALPCLTDIRLLNTPLWIDSPTNCTSPTGSPSKGGAPFSPTLTTRQHVIARLPSLSLLNGTPIEPLERMDAERSFLRHFHAQPAPCPRFTELQSRYGPLAPLLEVQLGAPEYVEVVLSYEGTRRPFKLNVKQTVGQLRKELERMAGMRARVFYLDAVLGDVVGMEEMRGERRAVHSFNVRDGDEIIVQPK